MDLIEQAVTTRRGGVAGEVVLGVSPSTSLSIQEPTDLGSGWRGSTGQRRRWCSSPDGVDGRDRSSTARTSGGPAPLVGPTGGAAVLSADRLVQLRAALREAAEKAER
ncbi:MULTISPECIES: hypothetical protein [Actinosynnema]|uniref:Uncharacterized protein n=1 Tax=Actinosynnema pretiosum TaxID=42197 RepID=A0A290YYT7_9PSEU|nr:hypothetical protein [Actinosynnema pretiosum]ATE51898.1 hypothetical protein CNX65_00195 [Actinosynnema pretiosum]